MWAAMPGIRVIESTTVTGFKTKLTRRCDAAHPDTMTFIWRTTPPPPHNSPCRLSCQRTGGPDDSVLQAGCKTPALTSRISTCG
eukprot:352901-Chlamydomonas_euryale.AAC.10